MADKEVQTTSSKLNGFMEKNRKTVIAIAAVLLAVLVVVVVATTVMNNSKIKAISAIDEISYELTNGSATLSESELNSRCEVALEKVKAYTSKGGIAGARANMLAAEVAYNMKDYNAAVEYWKAVASKAKKTYLEPIAYYNVGACNEELKNLDAAAEAYKVAAANKEFVEKAHAKFSYGRVLEAQGKYTEAVAAYKELFDSLPDDTWAHLAKTRIIDLEKNGKAN